MYDGHTQSFHDGKERYTKVSGVGEAGTRLTRMLNQAVHNVEEIITAGTPSFMSALKYFESDKETSNVKRVVSPGTVVLHDLTSESSNAELDLEPACAILTRVVSHPRENIFTVDAGSKTMAAEAGHPMAYVFISTLSQIFSPLRRMICTASPKQILCRKSRHATSHTVRGTSSDSSPSGNTITQAWIGNIFDSSARMPNRKFVRKRVAHG